MHGTDIESLRNAPSDAGRREVPTTIRVERSERRDMDAQGIVESQSLLRQKVTIVNLSCSGCLIRSVADLVPGDEVFVMLPVIGSRRAIVRRIVDGCYGCAFDRHLHPSELSAAFAPPEEEDVQAIRRRIRDTIALNETGPGAVPEGRRSRLMSGLRRIVRSGSAA
jgi:hypothetical protein